jgi:sulfite exporter TauE/SafE
MLASITPLGERGRHSRWGITVTAYLLGATIAGAALGALAGELGALAVPGSIDPGARLAVVGALALVAAGLDARGDRVPGPRRQVNEDWLLAFRGWVYGVGYGAQLGLGITTVVSSAALYVAMVAAVATGEASRGALVMGCFGVARGLTLLAAAGVRRPEQLIALHARLRQWRGPARTAGIATLAAIAAGAVVGVLS